MVKILKLKAIHNQTSGIVPEADLRIVVKILKLKAIHNTRVFLIAALVLRIVVKILKLKAIHNINQTKSSNINPANRGKNTKTESNSQLAL